MQNQIPKNWQTLRAEDLCTRVTDGTHDTPRRLSSSSHPLITSKQLKDGQIGVTDYFISEEDFIEVNKRSKVDQWDVLFGMIGTVGDTVIIRDENPQFAIKNVGLFKTTKDEWLAKWLYYYFRSPQGKSHLKSVLRGTSQGYIPLESLRDFPISVPDNKECQKKIISILSSFDDKIEVNNKIAKTLEELAQAIFKEWFVKKNSKSDEKFIRDVGQVKSGNRPIKISSKRENDMIVPVYGANEIMGYTNNFLFSERVIITGRVGTIGKVFIINDAFWPSDNVLVILPKEKKYTYFLYFLLKRINFTSLNRGSSQPLITQGDLEKYPLPNFDEETVENFHESVDSFFNKLLILERENKKLVTLRDLFLPKLMRGEIRI